MSSEKKLVAHEIVAADECIDQIRGNWCVELPV